jgi:hypothetical protein
MERSEQLVVDFIFSTEAEQAVVEMKPRHGVSRLVKCADCGGENYILASELNGDEAKGIPASRMYECIACGEYRLG